jgi:hypothetical protein
VRSTTSATALAVAAILTLSNLAWAGSTGRRNTALAATALAVGAWSNGTGRAGRKNTAILTTAGAAVAWGSYLSKRKQEKRRARVASVACQPYRVACAPGRTRHYVCAEPPGRHLGWYKNGKHRDHDDDDDQGERHHGHHHDD